MFDTGGMMTVHDLEIIRRSAAMAPLSRGEAFRLIEEFDKLLRERAQIATILADLPSSFQAVRAALNELQRLVTAGII